MSRSVIATLLLLAATSASAGDSAKATAHPAPSAKEIAAPAQSGDSAKGSKKVTEQAAPKLMMTKAGVGYIDHKVGEGREVVMGDMTNVHYTVWLDAGDGKRGTKIDSSHDRNKEFQCTVGSPGLIKGWSDGMVGMKPGGTRELRVPPALGWGDRGMGAIPPNASVVFEITLVSFVK